MLHKNTFTLNESEQIKKLISQKKDAPINTQKVIRSQIRGLGFYYSDFRNSRTIGGYTVDNYNELIETGEIVITDQGND